MGKRRKARECALQILYQLEFDHSQVDQTLDHFWQQKKAPAETREYCSWLVRGLLSKQEEVDEAIQFMENLVEEEPGRPHIRRRLADLYRKAGRIPEAISQLDAAGEMLLDKGDRSSAIQVIETILAMNPKNLSEYQELLAQIRRGGKATTA